MRTHSTFVRRVVSISHVLDGHPLCGRLHGHALTITAVIDGLPDVPDAFGAVATPAKLELIKGVINELNRRDLNTMIPAGYTSPNGVAAYLLERLTQLGVVEVSVEDETGNGARVRTLPS